MQSLNDNPNHVFVEGDIRDRELVRSLFKEHQPDYVVNFAAESHVDRSIDSPGDFILTNVVGTFEMLEAARAHWLSLEGKAKDDFRFLHVSTDEVYGSLGATGLFTETTPYAPIRPTRPQKQEPTIWRGLITGRLVCLFSLQTVQTITVLTSFRKNSFHW